MIMKDEVEPLKLTEVPEQVQEAMVEKSEEMSAEMEKVNDLLTMDAWEMPIEEVCGRLVQINESLLRIAKINIFMVSAMSDYVKSLPEVYSPGQSHEGM